jgi:hypothetical protein
MLAGLVAAVGCGGDAASVALDETRVDSGVVDLGVDAGQFEVDAKVEVDAGSDLAAGSNCWQILKCIEACPETPPSCQMDCVAGGGEEGQAAFYALMSCFETAEGGTCAEDCKDGDCFDCLDQACRSEGERCRNGQLIAGFGDPCDVLDPQSCVAGLTCYAVAPRTTQGYCNKRCPQPGEICEGSPPGMLAGCIMPLDDGGTACGFLCRVGSRTFDCPEKQNCSTAATPPESDQYLCIPEGA